MNPDAIKQLIQEILERMNVAVKRVEVFESDNGCRFAVETSDSSILIGPHGAHLFALNHLVRKIATKGEIGERRAISVDINGYQEAAAEHLKNLAKIMGDRARSFKVNVTLDPMSSYERMLIHSFFQEAADITTESIGERENRRVVIKYTGE